MCRDYKIKAVIPVLIRVISAGSTKDNYVLDTTMEAMSYRRRVEMD